MKIPEIHCIHERWVRPDAGSRRLAVCYGMIPVDNHLQLQVIITRLRLGRYFGLHCPCRAPPQALLCLPPQAMYSSAARLRAFSLFTAACAGPPEPLQVSSSKLHITASGIF
ncbi:MAG TPA: hypothetical protein VIL66_08155 [Bacillota bacterium]